MKDLKGSCCGTGNVTSLDLLRGAEETLGKPQYWRSYFRDFIFVFHRHCRIQS